MTRDLAGMSVVIPILTWRKNKPTHTLAWGRTGQTGGMLLCSQKYTNRKFVCLNMLLGTFILNHKVMRVRANCFTKFPNAVILYAWAPTTLHFPWWQADTSQVVWSWHSDDPADPNSVPFHQHFGTTSLNLLGGLNNPPPEPADSDSFIIASINVSSCYAFCNNWVLQALIMFHVQVTIPNDTDTTYWCTGHILPQEIREKTRYIYKVSLTPLPSLS